MSKAFFLVFGLLILTLLFSGCISDDPSLAKKDKLMADLNITVSDLKSQLIVQENAMENEVRKSVDEKERLLDFFSSYLKTINYFVPAGEAYTTAIKYYDKASLAYEERNREETISNCEEARTYFLEGSHENNKAKAAFGKLKPSAPSTLFSQLIDNYRKIAEEAAKYNYALYEACEHFESASRYYKADDYDMGGLEIGAMNEKVKEHDAAIKEYNEYLSQIDILLETS